MQKGGVDFALKVVNDPKANEQLLIFLVEGLKDPIFKQEVAVLSKKIALDVIKDSEVQRDLI